MKKYLYASGLAATVLAALTAAGCSAESGTPQEGANVGSTQEAITANLTGARDYGDACRLSITSGGVTKELVLFAAGYDALSPSKSVQNNIYLAEQGTGFVTPDGTSTTTLPTSVAHLKVVNDPNSPLDSCIAYGGEIANGTAQSSAVRLTVSKPSAYHIASTTITNLTARTHFQTLPCGTGALIAVNGIGSAGATLADIQVLKAGATAFTNVTVTGTLRTRHDFGLSLVGDGTKKNFVASLGDSTQNGQRSNADVLQFTNADCDAVTVTQLGTVLDTSNLAAPTVLSEVEAFETNYDSTNKLSKIIVPGGKGIDGNLVSKTFDSMSTIVIDMNSTPSVHSKTYTASALQGAESRYKLVIRSNGDAYISGGVDGSGTALSYVSKFPANGTAFATKTALSNAREGQAFIDMPSTGILQVLGGNSGTSVLNSDEEITP